eukprot:4454-Heterococcus_DN1.PRE.1
MDLSTVDVVFCYCSTWPARGDVLTSLSYSIGSQFAAGTVIVTTDRQLASEPGVWEFEQLHTVQGTNQETGGSSTAYIWKLVLSARAANRSKAAAEQQQRSSIVAVCMPQLEASATVRCDQSLLQYKQPVTSSSSSTC